MAQHRISAYGLILIVVTVLVILSMGITVSLARYVVSAHWNTLVNLQPFPEEPLVLNELQVIDLGQLLPGETQICFAVDESVTDTLTCNAPEGITAQLQETDGSYILHLVMESRPAATMQVQISVMAGEQPVGTFRAILPGTGTENVPGESDGDAEAPTEGSGSTEETVDNTEAGAGEETEPSTNPSEEATEPSTEEGMENSESGEQTEPPEDTVQEDTETTVSYLQVTPNLLTNSIMEISLQLNETADRVVLTLGDGFPMGTRYSADGGNVWYQLYFDGGIWLETGEDLELLVEIPSNKSALLGSYILKAESYNCDRLAETLSSDVCYGTVSLASSAILTNMQSVLTVALPECMGQYECVYTAEILTADADGSLIYTDATAAFTAGIDETNSTMTVQFAEQPAQAGTYRLNLVWNDGNDRYFHSSIRFFVSYSE